MVRKISAFDEYISYYNKYSAQFRPYPVAILYQGGAFFELYGLRLPNIEYGNVHELANALNIEVTLRDKSKPKSAGNCEVAGFPLYAIRHILRLKELNYYVVVIEQEKDDDGNVINRHVTRIETPGINLEHTRITNYLMTCFFQNEDKTGNIWSVGMSLIDVSTNKVFVFEAYGNRTDPDFYLDECIRLIHSYQPSEILIYADELPMAETNLINHLGISEIVTQMYCGKSKCLTEHNKVSFQNELLGNIYKTHGALTPIQYLHLNYYQLATRALVESLLYINENNNQVLADLKTPIYGDNQDFLLLTNNTIHQLNLLSEDTSNNKRNKINCVYDLLRETCCSIGDRLLRDRLLYPSISIKEINANYDIIDILRCKNSDDVYFAEIIKTQLLGFRDLEKLHRRLALKTLHPRLFLQLDSCYIICEKLYNIVCEIFGKEMFVESGFNERLNIMMNDYKSTLQLDKCSKYNIGSIEDNIFNDNIYEDLDEQIDLLYHFPEVLKQAQLSLSSIVAPNSKFVTSSTLKDPAIQKISKSRYLVLEKKFKTIKFTVNKKDYMIKWEDINVDTRNKGNNKLRIQFLVDLYYDWRSVTDEFSSQINIKYLEYLEEFKNKYSKVHTEIIKFIGQIDVSQCLALISLKYNYVRPEISDNSDMPFFKARQVRHPLIEHITSNKYIPNDISIGTPGQDGILLYGVNGVGKTAIMKTAGLCVILAQAGCFVPATSFIFSPFKQILTRIIGNDNLFKNQSTYAVEMNELRSILDRHTSHSLILGDEICHGTEVFSGTAIIAASIIAMSKKRSKFIFATHLHNITHIPEIRELTNIKEYHLSVTHDEKTGNIIYERDIKLGAGKDIYGIEVAEILKLPKDVVQMAYKIRNREYTGSTSIKMTKSNYNNEVYLNKCIIDDCTNDATETHHLLFKSQSDDFGLVGIQHKNHESNLVQLCNTCHQLVHFPKEHEKQLILIGFYDTSDGRKLRYVYRERKISLLCTSMPKIIKSKHHKLIGLIEEQTR